MQHRATAFALLLCTAALTFHATKAGAVCPSISVQAPVTYPTTTGPVEVVAADFTGDGIPDLALTGSNYPNGPGYISVLPGLATSGVATGTYGTRIDTPMSGTPLGLATADLDADGHADLIVGNWGDNTVVVLRGVGGGHFAAPLQFFAGIRPYEVLASDFNGDGVLDLAVADNGENSIRILLGGNDGGGHWNGTFAPSVAYATANLPLSIAAGDFNNDGITDLVATESFAQSVAVFLGNGGAGVGDGTFLAATHVPAGPEPYELATGDFNGDGHLDVAVAVSSDGGMRVLLGSGTGTFPINTPYLPGVNCGGVSVADFDGDGILDIAVTGSVANSLYLLKGQGSAGVGDGTFASPVTIADCCFPVHLASADLDQDGRADLMVCNYTGNTVAVFLDGCSTDPTLPRIARIRDVPNDQGGKVFITWTRSSLDVSGGAVNSYRVWRMVPPGIAAARAVPVTGTDARTLRSEIVMRANGVTDIVYWEALATLPAQRLPGYGYTAATPQDSLPDSNPLFTYRISALTANIDVYYDSDPDSGYSVDNIPPEVPGQFAVDRSAGANQLHWAPSPDADFQSFRLYRSSDPSFTPSPATLLATLTTPGFVDPGDAYGNYKLESIDQHGNCSPDAVALLSGTTGVPGGAPGTTWLAAPSPNPMRNALGVKLSLAQPANVSLALYDQQGRRTRTLLSGDRPAGEITVEWDARDDAGHLAGAGLYFLELKAGGRRFVRRVVMIR
jgi:VCBS repeat protein/flagellar hook capping protein FlgD